MLKLEKKRIVIFLLLVMVFLIPLSYCYYHNNDSNILVILMLTPMLSMIITMLITKEKNTISLSLKFRQNKKYYLFSYLVIPFISYIGAIVFFLLFPENFDPIHSKYAISLDINNSLDYSLKLLYIIPLAMLLNPIGGIIQCFGEEIAWRGYLLKKLLKLMNRRKAIILNSIIWGLWHAPIVLAGFNYGIKDSLVSVIVMIFFCILVGIICSYFYIKTDIIWIPILIHASINAIDKYAPSNLFMKDIPNYFVGPDIQGIIGSVGLTFLCVVIWKRMKQ